MLFKSCKYMRNKSTRQKGKKTLTSQYQSFEQRLESLEDKKAAHMQTWCQKDLETYCKARPASKLTWCEPSGDHLDYRWRENIQRTSPQITGRAKAATMLRLEKCFFRQTLRARAFYTSPSQETQRKTFWLAIFRLYNVIWIMNNILSFTKGILKNQWNLSEEKIGTNFWNTLYV